MIQCKDVIGIDTTPSYINADKNRYHHDIKMEITPKQWFCFYGLQVNYRKWLEDARVERQSKQSGWFGDEKDYFKLLERMCKREPIDSTFFYIDASSGKVFDHDGRHRTLAAYELGIDKVPVSFSIWNKKFKEIPYHRLKPKEKRNVNRTLRHCLFASKYQT